MDGWRSTVSAEPGHVHAELDRLHRRAEQPPVSLRVAVPATILLVLWGNAVVLLGRRLGAPDAVTLAAHPALAIGVTVLLLKRGWPPDALGLRRPRPVPPSPALHLLLVTLTVAAVVAACVTVALDPSKALDVTRLLLGTAFGEEVLHRSALLALWVSAPVPPAVTVAVSVAAFAAWHVTGGFHDGTFSPLEVAVPAAGTFVFLWARLRYRSIAAPTVLHVATNLPGIVLGG